MAVEKCVTKKADPLINDLDVQMQTGLSCRFQKTARGELGLPFYKIGGRIYYRLSEVLRWIEQRKVN